MITLGLTGSIGMGKSTVGEMFADEGIRVYDADAAVHKLYAKYGRAVGPIDNRFPGAVIDGAVDRQKLSALLRDDPNALSDLEAIVHPLTREMQSEFLQQSKKQNAQLVVLDIPLLFEAGLEKNMDYIVVVSAPADVQRKRVLARPDMTAAKFETILSRQMPDPEKRERADFVIDTNTSLDDTRAQVKRLIAQLSGKQNA